MSKVKIVQIAMAATEEEWDTQYLDDKGRVWRQSYKMIDNPKFTPEASVSDSRPEIAEYFWEQIDLPKEPHMSNSKYSNDLPHTKITDEILKIIDEGDSNRYQVALRLTQYAEQTRINTIKAAIAALPKKLDIKTSWIMHGNKVVLTPEDIRAIKKYSNPTIDQAESNLKALIGGSDE